MAQKLTYETALKELEAIVEAVEQGNLPVDQLSVKLKRGQELIAFCKKQLTIVENDVNTILNHEQE